MRTRSLLALVLGIAALAACSDGGNSQLSSNDATTTAPPATAAATTTAPPTTTARRRRRPGRAPARGAPLPAAVQEVAATVASGHFYVVGGYDTQRNSSSAVFVFDGTSWTTGPALPVALNHPAAATIGTDVYVAGGFSPSGASNRVFVLANGATSWREVAPMKRPRGALALLALGGKLYAIGGLAGSVQVAIPEAYDPATNAWTDLPAMPHPRNHVAGYLDGAVACVAGGREPSTSARIDCYDPATGAWQERGSLPAATSGAAGVVLGGVTMVAGGEPSSETSIYPSIQELARDGVVVVADARAPPRHRLRGVPRPPVDVRRRHRARLPRGDRLHVRRAVTGDPAAGNPVSGDR